MTTGAGSAQQRSYSQVSAMPYGSSQSQAAAPVIGKYTSEAFYPSPLVLNVTGMDQYGNLSGSLWGMSTKPQNGWDAAWEYWQRCSAAMRRRSTATARSSSRSITAQPIS